MRDGTLTVRSLSIPIALLLAAAAHPAAGKPLDLAPLAQAALGGGAEAAAAASHLRRAGEAGVDVVPALFSAYERCQAGGCDAAAARQALDVICGVRDCADLRLFWHTDLEAATAVARREGKPILSLRLMGRLDEELSCANSRFFRTVFYRDQAIGALLRDGYVLHWRSVRPVPKVTIDFGDGGRLERTLTGNSIHYVLDARGRLVAALPGPTGPEAFRRALVAAERAARRAARLDEDAYATWANERLLARRAAQRDAYAAEYALLGRGPAPTRPADTASKAGGERAMLAVLLPPDDPTLRLLADRRREHVRLDAASRAFLLAKHGATDREEAERLVDSFEATVALDEVINQHRMAPAIVERLLAEALGTLDLEAFNDWVYAEVFATPLHDPWLGLAAADVYAALPASTRTAAVPQQPENE